MSDTDLAWLAGYLEGEACFSCGRNHGRPGAHPTIALKATDEDVVRRAAALMGAKGVSAVDRVHRKRAYRCSVHGATALAIMAALLPHMGLRRSARIRELQKLASLRPGHHYGETSPMAKLTASDVRAIRSDARAGISQAELARRFGVSGGTIYSVVTGRTWGHVR